MRPTIYVQLTTGRFSDLCLTSRLLPIRKWRTVDRAPKRFLSRLETLICLSDFRAVSEQTRTAARPSRLLTAFPFGYPPASCCRKTAAGGPVLRLFSFQRATIFVCIRLRGCIQTKTKILGPASRVFLSVAQLNCQAKRF